MSMFDNYNKGYLKGRDDAEKGKKSDLKQLKGNPYHGQGYIDGYSDTISKKNGKRK